MVYYFLKIVGQSIALPPAQLFNFNFLLGIFPASSNIAKILAVQKSGDKSDASNNRPIFILSPISKIFGKRSHDTSIKFLINTRS